MTDPRLRIADLTREHGYWQATITANGQVAQVDRKHGSWMQLVPKVVTSADGDVTVFVRREVPRWVAAALQADRKSVV